MSPEEKAAITYFLIFALVAIGMIIQGINLKKTKMDSVTESANSKQASGQSLILFGAFLIIWQAYELFKKLF